MRRLWPLNLLLLAGIVFFVYRGLMVTPAGPPVEEAPAADERGAVRALARELPELPPPRPREEFALIEKENLFASNRGPSPAPASAPAEAPRPAVVESPQDRYVLYGVVRVDNIRNYALIRDKKTPNSKVLSYSVGDALPGNHVVRSIEDRRILVSTLGGGEAELRLRAPKGPEDTGFTPRPVVPIAQVPPMSTPPTAAPRTDIQRRFPQQQPAIQQPRQQIPRRQPPPRVDLEEEDEDYYDDDEDDEDDEDYYDEEEE